MATDTITVVPTGFVWSTTAYSMQYQGLTWLFASNPALGCALCSRTHALERGQAGASRGWGRYMYVEIHRSGKFTVNHTNN